MTDDIIKRLREAIAWLRAQQHIFDSHPKTATDKTPGSIADNIAALLDRLDAAERENDALREDARRYRWLTDNCGVEMEDGTLGIEFWSDPENWNDLDNAIDAARAAERGKE